MGIGHPWTSRECVTIRLLSNGRLIIAFAFASSNAARRYCAKLTTNKCINKKVHAGTNGNGRTPATVVEHVINAREFQVVYSVRFVPQSLQCSKSPRHNIKKFVFEIFKINVFYRHRCLVRPPIVSRVPSRCSARDIPADVQAPIQ